MQHGKPPVPETEKPAVKTQYKTMSALLGMVQLIYTHSLQPSVPTLLPDVHKPNTYSYSRMPAHKGANPLAETPLATHPSRDLQWQPGHPTIYMGQITSQPSVAEHLTMTPH